MEESQGSTTKFSLSDPSIIKTKINKNNNKIKIKGTPTYQYKVNVQATCFHFIMWSCNLLWTSDCFYPA